MTDPRFHDDTARLRYQLLEGDDEIGYIEYDPVGTASILIKHTEVRSDREGQGLGSRLVRSALDHIRAQGRSVIPTCPYALAYIRPIPSITTLCRKIWVARSEPEAPKGARMLLAARGTG